MTRYKSYKILFPVLLFSLLLFYIFILYSVWLGIPAALFGALLLPGLQDLWQHKHAILRNYPIADHLRFLLEGFRPELRQYLIEADQRYRRRFPHTLAAIA